MRARLDDGRILIERLDAACAGSGTIGMRVAAALRVAEHESVRMLPYWEAPPRSQGAARIAQTRSAGTGAIAAQSIDRSAPPDGTRRVIQAGEQTSAQVAP